MNIELKKTYRLVCEGAKIIVLDSFCNGSITYTSGNTYETDSLDEMKAKIAELGLTLDPKLHAQFM